MIGETGDARDAGAPPPSFEEALARLEQIVHDLEGSDLTLEETLARYEEGSQLVRSCTKRLDEAEQRIRVLTAAREEENASRKEKAAVQGNDRIPPEDEPADGDDLPF